MADPWSGMVLGADTDIYGGSTAAQQAELDKVSRIFGGQSTAATEPIPPATTPANVETSPLWYALIALVVIGGGYALFKD